MKFDKSTNAYSREIIAVDRQPQNLLSKKLSSLKVMLKSSWNDILCMNSFVHWI